MISLIAALDTNNVIGDGQALPWRLPADLRRFRALTMGKPIIMGRRTFESLGKPLPGRMNIVLTRQRDFHPPGVHVGHTPDEVLRLAEEALPGQEVMVIGGGEVYRLFLDRADRLYLTFVHTSAQGKVTFPLSEVQRHRWTITHRESFPADDANPLAHDFHIWQRDREP